MTFTMTSPVSMTDIRYTLHARVSTENPVAIKPVLEQMFTPGKVKAGETEKDFLVDAEMTGPSARDLNRALLNALRKVEKRSRLRAEWTAEGVTEKFFDYVPKAKVATGT
jgi:hypothetical protein